MTGIDELAGDGVLAQDAGAAPDLDADVGDLVGQLGGGVLGDGDLGVDALALHE